MSPLKTPHVLLLFFVFAVMSCVPDVDPEEEAKIIENEVMTINTPNGFDFSTHQRVSIEIVDPTAYVTYDIFAYSDNSVFVGNSTYQDESGNQVNENVYRKDIINKPIFTGVPKNGTLRLVVTLPKYCQRVYLRRKENLSYSSELVDILNKKVYYNHTSSSKFSSTTAKNTITDFLYCVNGSGELFQVDPLDGQLTMISEMPMGSWTAAIDQENKMLYSIGRSSPYPLMKYSIENDTWEVVANLGMGGPRLDFNVNDKLLYFSNRDKLYTINPSTGQVLNNWNILGLHNVNGGDLAFAEDGTLFLCTFSGLYRLELKNNNVYDSTRISADNLPFQPTSMTFDTNQELWLANNASSSDLIIMDTQTGGWQYRYGINAGNNTNYGRTINDLTTFRIYSDQVENTDTDGDGILDVDDSFPNDAEKAFEVFTPSKYGTGSIAFEDLWPTYGDYDFNDLVFTYKAIAILNSDNKAVQIDFECHVKSNGAGYENGFGIEIEGLLPTQISSVTGAVYSHNYIQRNVNGTEANQQKAVVIFTDNADNFLSNTTVSIRFSEPINTETLGVAPFNPFIIVNKERQKEVHLPFKNPTSLGSSTTTVSNGNTDMDGNYISNNGLPWAISIIHDFKVPKEGVPINNAYNYFVSWASSGGASYKDWYKDNPGYRNTNNLEN